MKAPVCLLLLLSLFSAGSVRAQDPTPQVQVASLEVPGPASKPALDQADLFRFTLADAIRLQNPQPRPFFRSAKSSRTEKPRKIDILGSMVGYIDNAIVASEVRIRFDAGLHDPRPDRAEYFYAGSDTPPDPASPAQSHINFQQLYFNGEYAPFSRLSVFTQIPVRWIQPYFFGGVPGDLTNAGGISDVQAGFKLAAIASESRYLTFQLRATFPSGDGPRGLGTGHYSIEPSLLYYQRLSSGFSVEAELGDSHPIGGTRLLAAPHTGFAGDVLMYGVGPSYQLVQRRSYTVAPVLELVAWHVFGGLQTDSFNAVDSADGINVVNLKAGARANFLNGNSIYIGYGRALTSDIWYRDLLRVEYRYTF